MEHLFIVNELYLCVLHPNLIEYTAVTKSQNADTKCVYYNTQIWKCVYRRKSLFNTVFMVGR